MIIRFEEVIIKGIKIPDVELKKGQLISLLVESPEIGFLLKDYLTGKKNHSGIQIFKPLTFVEHITFKVPILDKLLNRGLVRHLIKREFKGVAYKESEVLKKTQVGANWRIKGLPFSQARILATILTIRKHSYIIYTTSGMDWEGAERLHQIVKEEINTSNGGAIEINLPAINGKRAIPEADKVIEIKTPSHNNAYQSLEGTFEFKLKSRL